MSSFIMIGHSNRAIEAIIEMLDSSEIAGAGALWGAIIVGIIADDFVEIGETVCHIFGKPRESDRADLRPVGRRKPGGRGRLA